MSKHNAFITLHEAVQLSNMMNFINFFFSKVTRLLKKTIKKELKDTGAIEEWIFF